MFNILMANNYYYIRGGAEKIFFDDMNLLREKGHFVTPFSINDERSIKENGFQDCFPNEAKGLSKVFSYYWNRTASKKLEKLLREKKYDIFHGHNVYGRLSQATTLKAKEYNLKTVISLHDLKYVCPHYTMLVKNRICEECKDGKYFMAILNRCHKDSLAASAVGAAELYFFSLLNIQDKVDCFIATSRFYMNKYKEMGFKGHIEYLPNFIEPLALANVQVEQSGSYLYVGRLSYEKGIMTLLQAFKDSNRYLKIVGDGPIKGQVEGFIHKHNLQKRVTLLGYLSSEKVYAELLKARALIVPSEWYENAPISVLEALASGTIVLGSNIGGIPEMVHDGQNGFLFSPCNFSEINKAIEKFESLSEKEIRSMKDYSQMLVSTIFSKKAFYQKLMEIYGKVLSI